MGITCHKEASKDIHVLFQRSPMPKQMAFSGTIWMLDLDHRVQPLDKNGFCEDAVGIGADGRETECEPVLAKVVVRAESVPSEGGFKHLQRVERDADIDAIVLAI